MPMWRRIFKVRQGKSSVLGFLKNVFVGETVSSEGPSKSNKKKLISLAIVASVVFVFFFAMPSHASDTASVAVEWIVSILAKILTYIAQMIAFLVLQMVDFLIQIVQYNNFVKAAPVRIGWPLIRDTVNMFFIIVVLVSAFATIIGYPKEFHYRGILPKLLLMAVLINFSKTLIGLMIDFSQVLTLTFVNGFKEAAGGNFVNALHIRESMSIDQVSGDVIKEDNGTITIGPGGESKLSIYQIFNMLLAAIFAVWILSLSLTLIIIMVIFFLARIILLWFLLITSPVMFFAWSLPGKLQKAFSAFTDQWWNRLSTALIGGPTMAFFLWISLAMAQASNGPDRLTGAGESSLYSGPSKEVSSNVEGLKSSSELGDVVVTQIGSSENLANFIIMLAFMLLGIQVAIQQSNALAPKLGSIAGAVGGAGGMMGVGVAGLMAAGKVADRGVRAGAAVGGKAVSRVGGAINERYGITNKLAGKLGRSGVPMTYEQRKSLMQHAAQPKQKAKAMSAEMEKALAQEDPLAQRKILENWATSGNMARSQGAKLALANLSGNTNFAKKLQKSYEDDAKSDVYGGIEKKYGRGKNYDNLSKDQKKEVDLQVEAKARSLADRDILKMQDSAKEFAEQTNNTELLDKLHEMRSKDPSKQNSVKEVESAVSKVMSDEDGYTKLKDDAYMDSATFLMAMKHKGWMDKDGNLTVSENDKDFKRFMGGRQGMHAKAHLDYIMNSKEGRERAKILMDSGKSDEERNKARYHLVSGKDGKGYAVVAPGEGSSGYLKMSGQADTLAEIFENVTDDRDDLRGEISNFSGAMGGSALAMKDIGVRLNNQKMADLTHNLQTIVASKGDDSARRRAMSEIIAKNEMSMKALFDIKEDGTIGRGAEDYRALMSDSLSGLRSASPEQAARQLEVMSSLAETAKANGGQALTEFQNAVRDNLQEFKTAYESASPAQRSAMGGALRRIGSEAEMAESKQRSVTGSAALSQTEQARVSFKGFLTTAKATGTSTDDKNQSRAAIEHARRIMHGTSDR